MNIPPELHGAAVYGYLFGYSLFIFVVVFAADFVWAWWTRACNDGKQTQAGLASVAVYVLSGVTILSYIEHPWLLVPACIGAFFGTVAAMRWLPEPGK